MSSSFPQSNPSSPTSPSSASSGVPESTNDGHRILSQDDNHETSNTSDAKPVSSRRSSKFDFRKSLSRLFKGDLKVKEIAPSSAIPSAPVVIVRSGQHAQSAAPDSNAVPVLLGSHSTAHASQTQSTTLDVPVTQMQPSPAASKPLRLDIFPKNVAKPTYKTDLPKPYARVDKTPQLVYCYSLLPNDQKSPSSASDSDDFQDLPLDDKQREWVQLIDPVLQDRYRWLVEHLVKAFADNQLKASAAVKEIVLVGPVLDRELYRSLLNCFISKFEETTVMDVTLLRGLVQLVECASAGYLVGDDLVRIATVLSKKLSITHIGTSEHALHLTLSLARVLDVMVAGKVKDLNRDRDHQPMLQLLFGLKDSEDVVQRYEAAYAYQALQYAPDDETPLQVLWRFAKFTTAGASETSRVSSLDPGELVKSIQSLQRIGAEVMGAISTGIEAVETLRVGAGGVILASESKFDFMKKRSWYLALQGTALFIRQGRLSDFNLVVSQAPCRHNANFQWGICRQLGEIAVDPLWDTLVRQQAIDFLGELYKSVTYWKPHADIKQWILSILVQLSDLAEVSLKDRALALLTDLKKDGTVDFPCLYSLGRRLPLPTASPLLAQVQEIPRVDYDLNALRLFRIADFKQPVYIAPMAKPSLKAPDDTLFPLMEKVEDFLAGDGQVMLILGDSGAGKSTFNRQLEYKLWQDYKRGDRIPLFINLPSLERPEKDLVVEHLKLHNFMDDQILELKQQHQFTLICDGYDESQLKTNLHNTNSLNQFAQWNTKLLITCRTQYLGLDYRSRFAPMASDRYTRVANDLFQEAVIAPFTMEQIENYVDRYTLLEPRPWTPKEYMDKMNTIPNLMNLVKNPFLLTLCLEALPSVVEGKSNLSQLHVTRVQLYDIFVQHWLGVNKRRLEDQMQVLSSDSQLAFDALVEDGFEGNGITFQQDLAAAIFQEQDGKPIVVYIQKRDGASWKAPFFGSDPEISLLRSACLLSRAGTRHRFVHRSILEYFYSCTIISGSADSNGEYAQLSQIDSSNIGDHPLSQRNLVVEPSIIQFLAERVQFNPGFKQQLFAFIEQSKTDDRAACAAANAITILVKAGVSFNGADLRGIRVPEADVSGGEFDAAQLQEANLTGVNFTRSWIRHVNFSKARMEGVKFGELPHLEEAERVMSIAYSVDGKFFALGLDRGNINIYNTTNWEKTRTLEGHRLRISGVAYSPSGEQLLSGCFDNTVRLWSCKTGSAEFILEGHTNKVKAVAFSPAGNQVASASDDKTVRLWDSRTGSILFVLLGHTGLVLSIAYSPDGLNIVSGSSDNSIRTFNTHTGQMDLALERKSAVRCVGYSPDGLRIVAGDDDGYLLLWEPATGKLVERLKDDNAGVYAVVFSPNGQWIASSSHDYAITLWEAHPLTPVSVFIGHGGFIESVAFSPDSQQLASGCWDNTVRLWDITAAGAELNLVANQSDQIKYIAYSLDGRNLISLCCSGTIRQYDAATGKPGPSYPCGTDADVIMWSPDGRRIAAFGSSNDMWTWDADTGVDVYVLQGHTRMVYALAYSPDGQRLVSGSFDKTVRLWNACSGTLDLVLFGHNDTVVTVAFSPCGLQVASGCRDGIIRVWNVGTGESRVAVDIGANMTPVKIGYSPSGMQIGLQRHGGYRVELWNEEGLEALHNLQHDANVRDILLSPCRQWIATYCADSIWLWKLVMRDTTQEWELVLIIRDILKTFSWIDWRPEASEFATGGLTGSVQVWKLVETPDNKWTVRLVWGTGRTAFAATDAVIADVVGLGEMNYRLLKQRGARDGSLPAAKGSKHPLDITIA